MARRQLAPSGGTSGARRNRAVLAWTPVRSRGRPAHVFLTVKSRDRQFNTLLEVQSWNHFPTALRESLHLVSRIGEGETWQRLSFNHREICTRYPPKACSNLAMTALLLERSRMAKDMSLNTPAKSPV